MIANHNSLKKDNEIKKSERISNIIKLFKISCT